MSTRDLIPQMEPWFDEKEARALHEYMLSGGWVTEFKKTKEFEDLICNYTKAKFCLAVNNGTVSLALALIALGVSAGDEVIVPDLTMIATANAAVLIGAKPVFVDVEGETLCLDIDKVEEVLSKKTKALIHVSFNGRTNDLNRIKLFCEEKGFAFIEDAAQSLGSFYKDKHLGRYGTIGSFSFSPPKIISTGQGGALITDSEELALKLKRLKDFGREKGGHDICDTIGYNFKFTDIQAVIGIEQMKKLDGRVKRKREIYKLYFEELLTIPEVEFIETDLEYTTPWFVDIYVEKPHDLGAFLREKNIGTRGIYPALHAQKAYNIRKDYPVSQKYSRSGLWLPSSSRLSDEEIKYITGSIREYYSGSC